jgi:hypothetical protein
MRWVRRTRAVGMTYCSADGGQVNGVRTSPQPPLPTAEKWSVCAPGSDISGMSGDRLPDPNVPMTYFVEASPSSCNSIGALLLHHIFEQPTRTVQEWTSIRTSGAVKRSWETINACSAVRIGDPGGGSCSLNAKSPAWIGASGDSGYLLIAVPTASTTPPGD